jgi:hypothetical protein
MAAEPDRRSPARTFFAIVVGVVFIIGLITVFRWVGSLLSMGFFVLVVAAIIGIILIARRR